MKVAVLYFTSTGNTERMAEALRDGFNKAGADVTYSAIADAKDFSVEDFDFLALGCSAQGAEVMDETVFMPFYEDNHEKLKGKPVFLFGSYGWGGGEYLETFSERAKDDGLEIKEVFTHEEFPEEEIIKALEEKAASFV